MHSYYLNVQRVGNISVNVYSFLCKHILSLNQIKERSQSTCKKLSPKATPQQLALPHSKQNCRSQRFGSNSCVSKRIPSKIEQRSYQRGMSRLTARSTRRQPATLLQKKMVSGSGSEEVRLSEMEVDTAHVYTYHHCHDHLQYSNSHF